MRIAVSGPTASAQASTSAISTLSGPIPVPITETGRPWCEPVSVTNSRWRTS